MSDDTIDSAKILNGRVYFKKNSPLAKNFKVLEASYRDEEGDYCSYSFLCWSEESIFSDDSKNLNFSSKPFYEEGDEVKIWRIKGRPLGRVLKYDESSKKYKIEFLSEGEKYTQSFFAEDLTLSKRVSSMECVCGVSSTGQGGIHSSWCNLAGKSEKPDIWHGSEEDDDS